MGGGAGGGIHTKGPVARKTTDEDKMDGDEVILESNASEQAMPLPILTPDLCTGMKSF